MAAKIRTSNQFRFPPRFLFLPIQPTISRRRSNSSDVAFAANYMPHGSCPATAFASRNWLKARLLSVTVDGYLRLLLVTVKHFLAWENLEGLILRNHRPLGGTSLLVCAGEPKECL